MIKDTSASDGGVDIVVIDSVTPGGMFSAHSIDPKGNLVLFCGKQLHSVDNFDVITRLE